MTAVIDPMSATVAGMTSGLSMVCCPARRGCMMICVRHLVLIGHSMVLMSTRLVDAA